ncbi:hypothetical protein, partial [Cronobacter sakazakii]|uniref:hypothetical protein n=1 Tax=Cronobacter sakazakii TaxID=28141 RepID=UPI0015C4891E
LKTKISGMNVVFSQTLIITTLNNEVEFNGDFKIRFKFDTNKEENDKGECLPKVKTNIKDGMNVHLINFFHVDASVSNTKKEREKSRFFRQRVKGKDDKEKVIYYYLYFATQSISNDNDAVLFTVNVTTTEEENDSDEE